MKRLWTVDKCQVSERRGPQSSSDKFAWDSVDSETLLASAEGTAVWAQWCVRKGWPCKRLCWVSSYLCLPGQSDRNTAHLVLRTVPFNHEVTAMSLRESAFCCSRVWAGHWAKRAWVGRRAGSLKLVLRAAYPVWTCLLPSPCCLLHRWERGHF